MKDSPMTWQRNFSNLRPFRHRTQFSINDSSLDFLALEGWPSDGEGRGGLY